MGSVGFHLPVALGATLVPSATLALEGRLGRVAGVLFLSLYAAYIGAAISAS
jgi:Ca2+/Na+ antiporter